VLEEADPEAPGVAVSDAWISALKKLHRVDWQNWSNERMWYSTRSALSPLVLSLIPDDAPDGEPHREAIVDQMLWLLWANLRKGDAIPPDAPSLIKLCHQLTTTVLEKWHHAYAVVSTLAGLNKVDRMSPEICAWVEHAEGQLFPLLAEWMPYKLEDATRQDLAEVVLSAIFRSPLPIRNYQDFLGHLILIRRRALRVRAVAQLEPTSPMRRYLEGHEDGLTSAIEAYTPSLKIVALGLGVRVTEQGDNDSKNDGTDPASEAVAWRTLCADTLEFTVRRGIETSHQPVVWTSEVALRAYLRRCLRSMLQEERRERARQVPIDDGVWTGGRQYAALTTPADSHCDDLSESDDLDELADLARVHVASLTPKRRAGVMLVHHYGLSSRCAAAWMDVSPAVFYGWTCRGLGVLHRAAARDRSAS
jgi:DNA-directed RNA polymerase specialized sigma24 family protein